MSPRSETARASPAPGGNQHLLQRVRQGDITYACRLTRTRTLIVLDEEGRELAFIYSRRDKQIISFLSASSLVELRTQLDHSGDK